MNAKKILISAANIWLFLSSIVLLLLSFLPFTVYLFKKNWPGWVYENPETWLIFILFAIGTLLGFWLLFLSIKKRKFNWILIITLMVIEGLSLIINYYLSEASSFTAVIGIIPLIIASTLCFQNKKWFTK